MQVDEGELRSLFEDCGQVADFFLRRQENGSILCFVEMSTQSEADKTISCLNGKRISGKMMWVKYAKARPGRDNKKEGNGGNGGNKGSFGRDQPNRRGEGFKRNDGGQYQGRSNDGQRDYKNKFGQGYNHEERENDRGQGRGGNFRNHAHNERPNQGYQGGKEGNCYGRNEGSKGGDWNNKPSTTECVDY